MIGWVSEPLRYPFMQHAFLAIILVGVICGVIGTFVTLRGLAFMGDALSHAVFPGVVVAYLLGGDILVGALLAGVLVSLAIGLVGRSDRVSHDTAIGIVFAGAFALGVALLSAQQTYTRDLASFLLGSILGVSRHDLILTAGVGVGVLLTMALFRREFTLVAFDRTFAQVSGLNLWRYDQLILVLLALAIVVSLQTVGNILVLALLVTPAATARLLTDRLWVMVVLAAVFGAGSGVVGLYVSYYQAIASGASVVLVATGLFVLVYLIAPRSGVIGVAMLRRLPSGHPWRDSARNPRDEGALATVLSGPRGGDAEQPRR